MNSNFHNKYNFQETYIKVLTINLQWNANKNDNDLTLVTKTYIKTGNKT